MLRITEAQFSALERQAGQLADERLVEFVLEQFPAEPLRGDGPRLLEAVGATRRWAADAGFVSEREVRSALILRFTFGAGLEKRPWVRAILEDPFGRKFDRLMDAARAQLRDDAGG